MSDAFNSGWTLKTGDGATPEVFTSFKEVISMSGLGKTNSLIKVTNWDSNGSHEYISGFADGQEISLEANYVLNDATQAALIADVNSKTNRNMKVEVTNGVVTKTFDFAVTPLSWVVNPGDEDKNTISFNLKISGTITES